MRHPLITITALVLIWVALTLLLSMGVIGSLLLALTLLAILQLLRRRPLSRLWAPDRVTIGDRRLLKVCRVAVLVLVPALLVLEIGGDGWVTDSWKVLLLVTVLIVAFALLRRTVLTVALAALVVTGAGLALAPHLASARTGDQQILAQLQTLGDRGEGWLDGYRDLAVAEVDLDATQPVRLAGIGAASDTRMEIGSLTKALTGLVIADSVTRGELRLDAPVALYLPSLAGAPAGDVTLRELVTHHGGYAAFGPTATRRIFWLAPLGRSFLSDSLSGMVKDARRGDLSTRGSYAYSTLGTAIAGQAAAAAAHLSYPELMRTRLFAPLGMSDTAIETANDSVTGGRTLSGLPVTPWVLDGYAPGGGAVSTSHDLAVLAQALLEGTAPGMAALDAQAATGDTAAGVGEFWQVTRRAPEANITWHNGQTSGYTSYLGLDRSHHRAVVVLSDVGRDATNLGDQLLTTR